MRDILIIGAGGVGKDTVFLIEQINKTKQAFNILGFIDDFKSKNDEVLGYKILGNLEYLKDINYKGSVVIAIADYKTKKSIVEKLECLDIKYETIIHPNINIHKSSVIGDGCILYEGCIISPDIKLGNHVIVSPSSGIGHDSIIDDYVSILWAVSIAGNVCIEEGCLLGSGSVVIQGKFIKKGSVIGAGAVVVKHIKEAGVYKGVPAVKRGNL